MQQRVRGFDFIDKPFGIHQSLLSVFTSGDQYTAAEWNRSSGFGLQRADFAWHGREEKAASPGIAGKRARFEAVSRTALDSPRTHPLIQALWPRRDTSGSRSIDRRPRWGPGEDNVGRFLLIGDPAGVPERTTFGRLLSIGDPAGVPGRTTSVALYR